MESLAQGSNNDNASKASKASKMTNLQLSGIAVFYCKPSLHLYSQCDLCCGSQWEKDDSLDGHL